jgi:hypothetical protein
MSMTKITIIVGLVFSVACGASAREPGPGRAGAPVAGTGTPNVPDSPAGGGAAQGVEMTYSGHYDVPVPQELAAAATYATPEVHWTVQNGTAHLDYDLPRGLVGDPIHVEFTGPFDVATNKGALTGAAGTAECTATATTVSCLEVMRGLLPINVDMTLIEQIAREEYVGPVQHRIDVTQRFIGDPIGIVRFELSTGVAEHEDAEDD